MKIHRQTQITVGVVLGVGIVGGSGRGVDVVGFEVLTVLVAVGVCSDTSRSATLLGKEKGRVVSHSALCGHVVTKHTLTHNAVVNLKTSR